MAIRWERISQGMKNKLHKKTAKLTLNSTSHLAPKEHPASIRLLVKN
jgi:hypothetical protein